MAESYSYSCGSTYFTVSGHECGSCGLRERLKFPPEPLKEAIDGTQRYLKDKEEAAWRAAFKPYAVSSPKDAFRSRSL